MTVSIKNTTLVGKNITLEPLALSHAEGLCAAGKAVQIWNYMIRPVFESVEDTEGWINQALEDAKGGLQIPFIIKKTDDGTVVGSTRYLDIQLPNRSLEVGWTFISPEYWGKSIGVEMKYLMFCEAFDSGFIRVQLKTDSRNHRAMKHIEKVGAIKEGVLRKHMLTGDGVQRNTVYYSIIEEEWPQAKANLEKLLDR